MGRTSEEVAARLVEVYDLPMTPEVYMVLARNEQSLLMSNAELLPGNFKRTNLIRCFSGSFVADTEKIYVGIIGDVLKELDKPYPLATRMKLLGTTEMRCAEICVEDMQLSISPKEFHTKYAVLCNQRLGTAPLMLGRESGCCTFGRVGFSRVLLLCINFIESEFVACFMISGRRINTLQSYLSFQVPNVWSVICIVTKYRLHWRLPAEQNQWL